MGSDESEGDEIENLTFNLSGKQIKFCEEYVFDWNGSRSAIAAGYSENCAKEQASRLLTKANIKAYIEFLKTDTARLAGISALSQLQELRKIAYSSIAHLHNTWIEQKDFDQITNEQKEAIESIDTKTEKRTLTNGGGEGVDIDIEVKFVKIKLYSKTQALDMINKMLGFNAPKKIEIETTELSAEERARRIKDITDRMSGKQ